MKTVQHATTVVSNVDKITNFALDKLQHLIDAASAALPKATQYTLQVISMQCLISIINWLILLIVTLIISFMLSKFLKKSRSSYESTKDTYSGKYWKWWVPTGVIAVASFLLWLTVICQIPYWSFIGVFHPDLYLIHLAVDKIAH